MHLACRSLREGETRLALACGVNVICAPETSIALSKAHMLAQDGRCKTFDASADGYARGEGCGVLVLKRQSDAIADGDHVLAVIRGTAVNQDGRSGGSDRAEWTGAGECHPRRSGGWRREAGRGRLCGGARDRYGPGRPDRGTRLVPHAVR